MISSPDTQEFDEKLNKEYKDKTGVEMTLDVVPSTGDPTQKLIAAFSAGGSDYDAVRIDCIDLPQYASARWIMDVTDRFTKEMKDDLIPFALTAMSYQGKLYGMPKDSEWKTWVYNEKKLKDAGAKAPETWDEYMTVAQALQDKSIVKYAQVWAWVQGENSVCDFAALIAGMGGQVLDKDENLVINQDPGVKTLQLMVDMQNTKKTSNPSSLTAKNKDARDAEMAGDTAFGLHWGTPLVLFNDPKQSKVANECKMGLMPHASGQPSWTVAGPECWGVSNGSKNKDAAWDYLQFRAGKDGSKRAFLDHGSVFGWKSLLDDPEVQKKMKDAQVDLDVYRKQAEHIINRPALPFYGEFSTVQQAEIQNALTGKKTPKQALDDTVAAYQKLQEKNRKK